MSVKLQSKESQGPYLHKSNKKMGKNYQKTFSELWNISQRLSVPQVICIQEKLLVHNMNSKFYSTLTYPALSPVPQLITTYENNNIFLTVLEEAERTNWQRIICFDLSVGSLEDRQSLTQSWPNAKAASLVAFVENFCRLVFQPQLPEVTENSWENNRLTKKLGRKGCGIRCCDGPGNLDGHMHAVGCEHAQKRPEKALYSHLLLTLSLFGNNK